MKTVAFNWAPAFAVAAACALITAGQAQAAAAARPDFTGVWTNAGAPALGGTTNVAAPTPPIRPAVKVRVDAFNALINPTGETAGQYCLGYGMPQSTLGSGGYPLEIIQRPEQITTISEAHTEVRHIYFGARNAPEDERLPGRNGYSSGRWEGAVLVVETDNLVEQLDQRQWPHSDEATIVERYYLEPKPDAQGRRILVDELTMTDPKFYTAPVKATKRWAQIPNGRLLNYECPEETWHIRLEALAKAQAEAGHV